MNNILLIILSKQYPRTDISYSINAIQNRDLYGFFSTFVSSSEDLLIKGSFNGESIFNNSRYFL